MKKGVMYAAGAYTIWGLFPLYWKNLAGVPALEILSHRIVWSLVFMLVLLTLRHKWAWLKPALRSKRTLLIFLLTGTLLSLNWLTYIWAVNAGFIIETSLGYFINPLVSVLLGVIFLRERLRSGQWLAIGIAALGVLYLTVSYGALPWISLTLAFSFGTYGLIRKIAPLGSQEGLTLETAWMFVPAFLYLLFMEVQGTAAFPHSDLKTNLLLGFAGVATAVPLLLFASGARLIPLNLVGILQYIAPTIQFLIGVFVYHEAFSQTSFIGFSIVWAALIIFTIELLLHNKKKTKKVRLETGY